MRFGPGLFGIFPAFCTVKVGLGFSTAFVAVAPGSPSSDRSGNAHHLYQPERPVHDRCGISGRSGRAQFDGLAGRKRPIAVGRVRFSNRRRESRVPLQCAVGHERPLGTSAVWGASALWALWGASALWGTSTPASEALSLALNGEQ